MPETDIGVLDLNYLGKPEQVCAGVVPTSKGFVLVDCGPRTTIEALQEGLQDIGLALSELRAILLTHIHLDHAGATGTLMALAPECVVYVHGAKGAQHLKHPEKLVGSARQLYTNRFDEMWGEMVPVDGERVVELAGGESITVEGRTLSVLATPGHAWHHVSYLDEETRVLFAGDAAGLREQGSGEILPYTPPPDIDLEAWKESLGRIRAARPESLLLTHFGRFEDPERHLETFERKLLEWGQIARPIAESDLDLKEAGREFVNQAGVREHRAFEGVADLAHCGQGLVRYWRKIGLPAERR